MDIDKVIQERKSVRKFSPKKPDWRDIIECIDAMRYAPAAGNNHTLKIILVSDAEKINSIAEACQQKFVSQAQYVVVVCSNPERLVNAYEENGEKFNIQQNAAAVENFLLKIVDKGLATCWVGYFVESQIKSILKIPDKFKVEVVLPVGYESKIKGEKPSKRNPIELDNILYFDKFDNKRMSKPREPDA